VSKQKLDLFNVTPTLPTELRARPSQIVGTEPLDSSSLFRFAPPVEVVYESSGSGIGGTVGSGIGGTVGSGIGGMVGSGIGGMVGSGIGGTVGSGIGGRTT